MPKTYVLTADFDIYDAVFDIIRVWCPRMYKLLNEQRADSLHILRRGPLRGRSGDHSQWVHGVSLQWSRGYDERGFSTALSADRGSELVHLPFFDSGAQNWEFSALYPDGAMARSAWIRNVASLELQAVSFNRRDTWLRFWGQVMVYHANSVSLVRAKAVVSLCRFMFRRMVRRRESLVRLLSSNIGVPPDLAAVVVGFLTSCSPNRSSPKWPQSACIGAYHPLKVS